MNFGATVDVSIGEIPAPQVFERGEGFMLAVK